MAKMTLEQLRKLREEKKKQLDLRDPDNKQIHIVVGMGTSGIAAGAKETLDAFLKCIENRGLTNVAVRQVGSFGLDYAEPTVEVVMPDMPRVIYGKVTPDVAEKIVLEHIIGKKLVENHVYDRPAADIVDKE